MPLPERFAALRPSDDEVREFCKLCEEIERRVLAQEDASELLSRWNARAHRAYDAHEFTTYSGAVETTEFVTEALGARPSFVRDLTYPELRAVFECVQSAATGGAAEHSYFLRWLEVQLPDSNISDLIYWPQDWFGVPRAEPIELSIDQLLRAAMERSGRVLPGAPNVAVPLAVPKKRVLVTPPPGTGEGSH